VARVGLQRHRGGVYIYIYIYIYIYVITVPVLEKYVYVFASVWSAATLLTLELSLHRMGNSEYFTSATCRCHLRTVVLDKCKILKTIFHLSQTVYLMWNEHVARHLVINSIHSAVPIRKWVNAQRKRAGVPSRIYDPDR